MEVSSEKCIFEMIKQEESYKPINEQTDSMEVRLKYENIAQFNMEKLQNREPNKMDLPEFLIRRKRSLSKQTKPCPMDGCNRVLSSQHSLKQHLLLHAGIEPYTCDYPGCTHRCRNLANLRCHKELHLPENERPRYHCTEPGCFRVFHQRSSLRDHRRVHEDRRPHICEFPGCGKTFRQHIHLKEHHTVHLSKEDRPKYSCTYSGCTKVVLSKRTLKTHMLAHDPEVTFVCQFPKCEKVLPSASRLRCHVRRHMQKLSTTDGFKRRRRRRRTDLSIQKVSQDDLIDISLVPAKFQSLADNASAAMSLFEKTNELVLGPALSVKKEMD